MKYKTETIVIIVIVALLALMFLTDFSIPGVFGDEETGVEITVHFTDGTEETYGGPTEGYLVPLTIIIDDKPIEYIEYAVWAMLTWEGDYQWLRTATNVEIYIEDGSWKLPLWNKEGQTEDMYNSLISGEWFCVYGPESIYADTLNFILADQHKHGIPVNLVFKPVVASAMLMNDGTTAEREGSAQGAVTLMLEEQAESVGALGVQIWTTPF